MKNVVLIRYGEIFLKGKNFRFFENKLYDNVVDSLSGIQCEVVVRKGWEIFSDLGKPLMPLSPYSSIPGVSVTSSPALFSLFLCSGHAGRLAVSLEPL